MKMYLDVNNAYQHWCPGCNRLHGIPVPPSPVAWSFNQSTDLPSFMPSVKHEIQHTMHSMSARADVVCHYFLTEGRIHYLADCTHSLAGCTIELPNIPGIEDENMSEDI